MYVFKFCGVAIASTPCPQLLTYFSHIDFWIMTPYCGRLICPHFWEISSLSSDWNVWQQTHSLIFKVTEKGQVQKCFPKHTWFIYTSRYSIQLYHYTVLWIWGFAITQFALRMETVNVSKILTNSPPPHSKIIKTSQWNADGINFFV